SSRAQVNPVDGPAARLPSCGCARRAARSPGSLSAAGAEVRVVAFGAGIRVVAVGEDRDTRRRGRLAGAEEPLVVGQHVHPLVHPLAALLGPAREHADLGEPTIGGQPRVDRYALAPDVLDRLRTPDA